MDSYLTVARDSVTEVETKGSRFVCTLRRVSDEEQARAVIAELRQQHPDARHHCSAFVLGPDGSVQRSSDDGEPSGTAGAPMLEVLRGAGLTDVVAVVTRWFGGNLLGAGGLVRAYGDAVRAAVSQAGTQRRALLHELAVELDHANAGRVESDLRTRGVTVLDVSHAETVMLVVGAPPDDVDSVESVLAQLTGGQARMQAIGERWVDA